MCGEIRNVSEGPSEICYTGLAYLHSTVCKLPLAWHPHYTHIC